MGRSILMSLLLACLTLGTGRGEDVPPAPTPWPLLPVWRTDLVPWETWFKKNALVTPKAKYVHYFWNAQDFKNNFEGKEKKDRLAEAALQLVSKRHPADAKTDLVKVDIVYVLERDSYGMPRWDSLKRVAHLEFLRSKIQAGKAGVLPAAQAAKAFDKFDIY